MELIFIRHSKTNVDAQKTITDWDLSPRGVELARALSTHEIIQGLDVIYASSQKKAIETAKLLALPNIIPVKVNGDLTEVTSFTQTFEPDEKQYEKNVQDYYAKKIARIAGGETQEEAVARFTKAVELIVAAEVGKQRIGIVSHGNILTLFCAQFIQIDCYAMHKKIKQPDIAVFDWDKKKFINFFGEVV